MANIEYSAIISYTSTMLSSPVSDASFYIDICGVIDDECRHLQSLVSLLEASGHAYPSFPVNSHILADLDRTSDCLRDRIAMISLVHEAKGLDAGDRLADKCRSMGCRETLAVVEMIVREEREHVRFGVKWFSRLCLEKKLDPKAEYMEFLKRRKVLLRPQYMNFEAREAANFPKDWIPIEK